MSSERTPDTAQSTPKVRIIRRLWTKAELAECNAAFQAGGEVWFSYVRRVEAHPFDIVRIEEV